MTRIGKRPPPFRVPALVEGHLTYIGPGGFEGRWVALCFLFSLGLVESVFLDRRSDAFMREGAALLVVVPDDRVLRRPWCGQFGRLRVPLLTDPLGRLHRAYGTVASPHHGRCRTVLIDPNGIIRFHLIHDLNGRGLAALLDIIAASRGQEKRFSPVGHQRAGVGDKA
jgi:alkyl hydroperoxide reductase subunit AhpC